MKVVINNCFGGFSLSPEATLRLWELGGEVDASPVDEYFGDDNGLLGFKNAISEWRKYLSDQNKKGKRHIFLHVFSPDEKLVLNARDTNRHDPKLIQVIEEMGKAANGGCADLKIVEIPDGVDYEIQEYDGNEHIAEKHRTWG